MAKHLTAADVEAIVNFIYGAGEEFVNWKGICEGVEPLVGKCPTRQSLSGNIKIVNAYKARKAGIRQAPPPPKPASLAIAAERIRRLETENLDLRRQNALLLEQFAVMQYNAYKHGLKEQQLTAALPRIDRERTDDH